MGGMGLHDGYTAGVGFEIMGIGGDGFKTDGDGQRSTVQVSKINGAVLPDKQANALRSLKDQYTSRRETQIVRVTVASLQSSNTVMQLHCSASIMIWSYAHTFTK